MPKLVVMMPAKDAAPTISLAIKSVLRAMPRDAELVVWDDASTDGTPEVVSAIKDSRVRLISSTDGVGSGRARAQIMENSSSEFVACMDADDVCFPWRFSEQLHRLNQVDLVFGSTIRFSTASRGLYLRPSNPTGLNNSEIRAALLVHNPLSQPTMSARRNALESVGGYRDLPVAQDYELWLRASTSGLRMAKSRLPVVGYRESRNQISRTADYYERVRASAALQESYRAHVESEAPEAFAMLQADKLAHGAVDRYERILLSRIRQVSHSQHSYYERLVQKQGTFLTFR